MENVVYHTLFLTPRISLVNWSFNGLSSSTLNKGKSIKES